MKYRLALLPPCTALITCIANADEYVQPPQENDLGGSISCTLPAHPDESGYTLDDFTVTGAGWIITSFTFHCVIPPDGQGNETITSPLDVLACTEPSWTAPGLTVFEATRPTGPISTGSVTLDGLNLLLSPGHYWLSAWAQSTRPQPWYWLGATGPPYGDPAVLQNPGGAYGFGTDPVTIESLTFGQWRDAAFTITYTPVPEPQTIVLIAAGTALLLARRRH